MIHFTIAMLGASAQNLRLGRTIRSARVGQQARHALAQVRNTSLSAPNVYSAGAAASSTKRPAERKQVPPGGKRALTALVTHHYC